MTLSTVTYSQAHVSSKRSLSFTISNQTFAYNYHLIFSCCITPQRPSLPLLFHPSVNIYCHSQWLHVLRRMFAAPRLLILWVRILRGHGCLSLVSVVCCLIEVFASGWSLMHRSPPECGVCGVCVCVCVCMCDHEASIIRILRPTRGRCAMGENINIYWTGREIISYW